MGRLANRSSTRLHGLSSLVSAALFFSVAQLVAGHGDDPMQVDAVSANGTSLNQNFDDGPLSYFRHSKHTDWMYAHIALMIVSWLVILPQAIMLSVAHSRYTLLAQSTFHAINAAGMVAGFVYKHATPELYAGNVHHPIGWVVTSLTVVWTVCTFIVSFAPSTQNRRVMPRDDVARYAQIPQYEERPVDYRAPRDSGNFSSASRDSLGSDSGKEEEVPYSSSRDEPYVQMQDPYGGTRAILGSSRITRLLTRSATCHVGMRVGSMLGICGTALEPLLLLLGFTALTSGFIVYGGLFRGQGIYSGMAHYAKGAIFFWYGLLTLGRWMGAWRRYGWAWNIRPVTTSTSRWGNKVPSAEFTESFVIWLYGATNVFMERMNSSHGWSAQDFEHVSITILFFGGGLLGMLIESRWIGKMLDTTTARSEVEVQVLAQSDPLDKISMNPIPALVILLLGTMMSSHHQSSMVSTMLHAQWGTLFSGFALCRGLTYTILYIKPPNTTHPSRPPTELVASFCLIAGGLLFMNSAHDVVAAIERNGLDAMTIFTVAMGVTGLIMAWEMACFAVKEWALRKESKVEGWTGV